MSSFGDKLVHEIRELIPVTLYFFAGFLLLAITQSLMLAEYGIRGTTLATVAVGALVVAKVLVIADHFPFINRFSDKPLIYGILWKTAIYFLASLAVRYVEHIIRFWGQTGGVVEANRHFFAEINWPHFWCVQMWLLLLLLFFCTLRVVIRAISRERMIEMFFVVAPLHPDRSGEHQPPSEGRIP